MPSGLFVLKSHEESHVTAAAGNSEVQAPATVITSPAVARVEPSAKAAVPAGAGEWGAAVTEPAESIPVADITTAGPVSITAHTGIASIASGSASKKHVLSPPVNIYMTDVPDLFE